MHTRLSVLQAGPLVSVQDLGRRGHLRFGVTGSGAMDRVSYRIANAMLGNEPSNPAIEVSLGGLALRCDAGAVRVAIVGGCFSTVLNDQPVPPWALLTLNNGDTLKVRPGEWGSWCYLAFAGKLDAPQWLDSHSVHLASGVCGQPLEANNELTIDSQQTLSNDIVSIGEPDALSAMARPANTMRVVLGPQDRFFDEETLSSLIENEFTLSPDYDRMGLRLSGCKLPVNAALDMPSEPLSRGSLQVPGHGDPICLMADHQTAGGYPKIATVISVDQDVLAQHRAGELIRFELVTPQNAVQIARQEKQRIDQLIGTLLQSKAGMTERLWKNNLISGTFYN